VETLGTHKDGNIKHNATSTGAPHRHPRQQKPNKATSQYNRRRPDQSCESSSPIKPSRIWVVVLYRGSNVLRYYYPWFCTLSQSQSFSRCSKHVCNGRNQDMHQANVPMPLRQWLLYTVVTPSYSASAGHARCSSKEQSQICRPAAANTLPRPNHPVCQVAAVVLLRAHHPTSC
jgi:hypothetical protein